MYKKLIYIKSGKVTSFNKYPIVLESSISPYLSFPLVIVTIPFYDIGWFLDKISHIHIEWIFLVIALLFNIYIFLMETNSNPPISSLNYANYTWDLLFRNPNPNRDYPISRKIFMQITKNESVEPNKRCHYMGFATRDYYNLTLHQEKILTDLLEKDISTCNLYTFGFRWAKKPSIRIHITQPCIYIKDTNIHPYADINMLQAVIKYETDKYENASK